MKIVLYGGTFNPPHTGHMAAAMTAWKCLSPDKLIWMPSGDPPHKQLPPGSPSVMHRLEMCRLMTLGTPGFEVSSLEVQLGLKYTFDTAEALRAASPDAEITLLVGGDMLLTLDAWHRAYDLLARYPVAALVRAGGTIREVAEKALALRKAFGARIVLLPHDPVDISSSDLRGMLIRGEGREYLTKEVFDHIIVHGLYQH